MNNIVYIRRKGKRKVCILFNMVWVNFRTNKFCFFWLKFYSGMGYFRVNNFIGSILVCLDKYFCCLIYIYRLC